MRHLKTTLAVLGAVTILVLAGNTIAMAATGKSFILGKINSANKQTTLTRTTNGPVLKLNAKQATGVPLAVRGSGKVANLNADKVDGLDSSALITKPYVFTRRQTTPSSGFSIVANVPPGSYLVSYSAYMSSSPSADLDFVQCYVTQINGGDTRFVGENYFDTGGRTSSAVSGAGFAVKTSATGVLRLNCGAAAPFINGFGNSEPFQFVLVPVNGSTQTNITARVTSGSPRAVQR